MNSPTLNQIDAPFGAGRPRMRMTARLNDEFRSTFEDGRVLMTAAVTALPVELRAAAIVAVQAHTVFTREK